MPVFRYFVVVGLALVGLLFAVDRFVPKSEIAQAAVRQTPSSIDYWRDGQKRGERAQVAAVDLTGSATQVAPTAERLQWERQLRYVPERTAVREARAEMPETTAAPAASTIDKPVAETAAPVRKRAVARLPAHPRTAANQQQDRWQRPYDRDPYRDASRNAWAGRFFNFF